MTITFLPLAQRELDNAFAWYENQVVGLGYEFLDALDQTLRMVVSFPEMHVSVGKNIRRCLFNRFPYAVYYGVKQTRIIVIAVAHLKQQPEYWCERIV